jgi:hypothetical protein
MRYLLLIFDDPRALENLPDAERARIGADYRAFTASLVQAGTFRGGDALEPVTIATTIRLRGGRRLVTDGPFAETGEQLVGYYLVEARDLDEAIAIAQRVPSARFGAVEVRPVMRTGGLAEPQSS